MSPISVITGYLPHIGTDFALRGIRCWFSEARHVRLVRLVSKGLLNRFHKNHPKSGRVKLAFSLAMTAAVSITLRGSPLLVGSYGTVGYAFGHLVFAS